MKILWMMWLIFNGSMLMQLLDHASSHWPRLQQSAFLGLWLTALGVAVVSL